MLSLSRSFSSSCRLAILIRASLLEAGSSHCSSACPPAPRTSSSSRSRWFSPCSASICSVICSHSLAVSCLAVCDWSRCSQMAIWASAEECCCLRESRAASLRLSLVLSLQFSSMSRWVFSSNSREICSMLRLAICSSQRLLTAAWISFSIATCFLRCTISSFSSAISSSWLVAGSETGARVGVMVGVVACWACSSSWLSFSISLLNMSSRFWYSWMSRCKYSSLRLWSAAKPSPRRCSSSANRYRFSQFSLSIWFSLESCMLLLPRFWLWNMSSLMRSLQKLRQLLNSCSTPAHCCRCCSRACKDSCSPWMACSCLRMYSTFMPSSLLSSPIFPASELLSANSLCASRLVKSRSSCASFSCPCSLPTVSLRLASSLSLSSTLAVQVGTGSRSALELWVRWLRCRSMVSKGELLASRATRSLTLMVLEQMFLQSEPVQGRFFSKLRILKKSFSSLLFINTSMRSFSGYRLGSFLQALWHLGLLADFPSCSGPSFLISFSKSFLMLESSAFMFWKKARLLPFSTVCRGEAFQSILQGTNSCSWLSEPRLEERVIACGVHLSALDFFIKLILKFITHKSLLYKLLMHSPSSTHMDSPSFI